MNYAIQWQNWEELISRQFTFKTEVQVLFLQQNSSKITLKKC